MAAPKGNSYWRQRLAHGRKHKVKTPAQLREYALEYLEHLENNPLFETKVITHQGEGYNHAVPLLRAPTLQGLWVHCNINKDTWYKLKDRKGFVEVTTWIEQLFFEIKFQGASAGLLKENIIARDLGLKDQKDVTTDGQPINEVIVSHD